MSVGFWPDNFWHNNYWHGYYWPIYGDPAFSGLAFLITEDGKFLTTEDGLFIALDASIAFTFSKGCVYTAIGRTKNFIALGRIKQLTLISRG